MKFLKDWCKNCFGMKSVEEKMNEELKWNQQEIYQLQLQMDWAAAQLKFKQERASWLLKCLDKTV